MHSIAVLVASLLLLPAVRTNQPPQHPIAFSGAPSSTVQSWKDRIRLNVTPVPVNFADKLPAATGSVPLPVGFWGSIPDADLKAKVALVDFGDGVRERVQLQPLTYTKSTPSPAAEFYQNVHTYTKAGTFIAKLYLVSDCSSFGTPPARYCDPASERPLDTLGTAKIAAHSSTTN